MGEPDAAEEVHSAELWDCGLVSDNQQTIQLKTILGGSGYSREYLHDLPS